MSTDVYKEELDCVKEVESRRGPGGRQKADDPTQSGTAGKPSDVEIRSVSEYVDRISKFQPANREDILLFRGQRRAWPLVPKLGRRNAVKGLGQLELGDVEQSMFAAFREMGVPFMSTQPANKTEWLAIAQHHGLPTRLLDWTANALAALWFAVKEPPLIEDKKKQPGVVWLLNPKGEELVFSEDNVDPFDVENVMIYKPRHINRRIIAQAGYFTLHPLDFDKSLEYCRLRQLETDSDLRDKLTQFTIAPEAFSAIRDSLERLGVSDLTMFPDVDGLCRFISWNNTLLEDEEDPPFVRLNQ